MLSAQVFDVPSKEFYKLDAMRAALEALGHPERGARSVLVAGTNGKGSVSAFLSGLIQAEGARVGLYQSPHLQRVTERIRIDGQEMSALDLERFEAQHSKVFQTLTFFERMTALAFLFFQERRVEFQVLEVGMGGRLDATNLSDPEVSVICSIGRDHEEVLGPGLEQIAREKAGVMRRGRPVFVSGAIQDPARRVLVEVASEIGADLRWVSQEDSLTLESAECPKAQAQNLKLALSVHQHLFPHSRMLEKEKQRAALSCLPKARFQILKLHPLWVVDGAHNEDSLRALMDHLNHFFPNERFHVVFGVMKDKDFNRILPLVESFVEKRAFSLRCPLFFPERQRIWEVSESLGGMFPQETGELEESWISDLEETGQNVLVFGSLYLAGTFLNAWEKRGRA